MLSLAQGEGMKSLVDVLKCYENYHRNPRNKALHFLGVPLVTFALFVPMGWVRVELWGVTITLGALFSLAVLVYYFLIDFASAVGSFFVFGALLWVADVVACLPFSTSLIIFLVSLLTGTAIQLLGHYFEGRKPALLDNVFQIFTAPLFVFCEACFFLGIRLKLRKELGRAKSISQS
jgi:uncharacterized membrane protein YGL010W